MNRSIGLSIGPIDCVAIRQLAIDMRSIRTIPDYDYYVNGSWLIMRLPPVEIVFVTATMTRQRRRWSRQE